MANALTTFAQKAAGILGIHTGSYSHDVTVTGSGRGNSIYTGRDVSGFDAITNGAIAKSIVDSMTAGDLYETQPHLRTVVSFVARNAAQLGRHIYAKAADDSRTRVLDSPAAQLLSKPNDFQTGYDLFNMLFSELALFDFALWVPVIRDGRWQIDPIPGTWVVGRQSSDAFHVEKFKIQEPGSRSWYFVNASDAIVFRGYSPDGFKHGSSTVRTLKGTLGEQVAAMEFREQLWRRGGRVGMYMTRPVDAPEWSPAGKAKFIQQWKASWAGSGADAGSTPLLEEGMDLKRIGFNAKEEQWLEAATLSLSTVAGAYHVPPAMVGVAGYNSFASVKEFRKMLYTETLGPLVAQVEETVNTFLLPFILEPAGNYLELNINEKLQGDFEEQATVLFQAVGGPYMTPDEARKKVNLPPIEGGDRLLAPLNMGAAGNTGPVADEPLDPQTDPADEDTPKANGASYGAHIDGVKAPTPPPTDDVAAMTTEIQRVMKRQRANGAGSWDQKKWNRELSGALQPHMVSLTSTVARSTAKSKSLDPDAYSVGQTTAFLSAVADSRADLINATTRDAVKAAAESDDEDAVEHVFDVAIDTRAGESAATMGTMLASWAVVETGKQLMGGKPKKTWIASGLPNSRHADMDGETVGIDETFSNGAQWPGDPVLGAEGVANCGCGVDIND